MRYFKKKVSLLLQKVVVTLLLCTFVFSDISTILQYPLMPEALAAVVAIDSTVSAVSTDHVNLGASSVFISDQVGYKFYVESDGTCVYNKTIDGGTTWGATPVVVDAQTDCIKINVWYDQWTPGDTTGTNIHISTMDTSKSQNYYNRLNTTGDILLMGSNPVKTVDNPKHNANFTSALSNSSITKGTDGVLYIAAAEASDSYVVTCSATTCADKLQWTGAGTYPDAFGDDYPLLMPLSNGNILMIIRDTSVNSIIQYTWNGSTWLGPQSVDTNAISNTVHTVGMTGSVDSNGDVYLAYITDNDDFVTADHDIRTAKYSSGSWTQGTDITTNDIKGITHVAMGIDANTNDVYVAYSAQATIGNTNTTGVYWASSTKSMSVWNAEQGPVNTTLEDIYSVDINSYSDERMYVSWYGVGTNSIFGDTLTDISPITKVTPLGTQVATVHASTTDFYIGGSFLIKENLVSRNVTNITISETGTVNAALGIDNTKLYYDLDTTAPYDCVGETYIGTESQFGLTASSGFSGSDGTASFSAQTPLSITPTQAMCIYTVMDVLKAAGDGNKIEIEISNPETDVVVSGGVTAVPTTAQRIPGRTNVFDEVVSQSHYHWRNDDGSEAAATSMTNGVEDTPLPAILIGSSTRLRTELSYRGSQTANVPVVQAFQGTAMTGKKNTTITLAAPTGIIAGELLLLIVSTENKSIPPQFTNNVTGWIMAGASGNANSRVRIAAYWKIATGAEGNVAVTAQSKGSMFGWYMRISGIDPTNPIDVSNFTQAPGKAVSHTIPGVTTSGDNALALYGLAFKAKDALPFIASGGSWAQVAEITTQPGGGKSSGSFGTTSVPIAGNSGDVTVTATGPSGADRAAYFQLAVNPLITYTGGVITEPYRLEYAEEAGSCADATGWTDVSTPSDAWAMYDSLNLTDGNDTTNIAVSAGGVTDLFTTFITPNAGVKDIFSQTANISLNPDEYVELEYSIIPTSFAIEGQPYCFRTTQNGVPLTSYNQYPKATVQADVSVIATSSQVATVDYATNNFYTGGTFAIIENIASRNVTSITVTENGTTDGANDVQNIRLYYEFDTTFPYNCDSETYAGTEAQYGATSTAFSSANGSSTFSGSAGISLTNSLCVYPVMDVTDIAKNGETIDVIIDQAHLDVVVTGGGSIGPRSTVDIASSTTIRGPLVTQTHYHWRNDDGNELGGGGGAPIVKAIISDGYNQAIKSNTPTITVPAGTIAGDYMVAIFGISDNNGGETITPPVNEVWTLQAPGSMPIDGTGAGKPTAVWIYTKVASADDQLNAGTKTYTWSATGGKENSVVVMLLGNVSAWGQFSTNLLTGNLTTIGAPSVVTTVPDEIVFHAAFRDSGIMFSGLPTGTEVINNSWGKATNKGGALAVMYEVYPTVGATGVKNFTFSSDPANAFTFSLKPPVFVGGGATSATGGVEDTKYLDFPKFSHTRLRLGLSNEGLLSSVPQRYGLEYGIKNTTCEAINIWTDVNGSTPAKSWGMYDSINLINGSSTTNIGTVSGGVTDENTTFIAVNGGIRDTESFSATTTFTPTQYTDIEYSIELLGDAPYETDFCFRMTQGGQPLLAYSQYAEASSEPKRDFKIQRGTETLLGNVPITLVAGVDYASITASTSAFVRITNSHYTGAGNDAGGGVQTTLDYSAYIVNPGNIETSFTISRPPGAVGVNTRVSWEIIEYIGFVGGDNEMFVRDVGTLAVGAAANIATGTALTNVVDANDVVVFITGQMHSGANSTQAFAQQFTSSWASSTNESVFQRGANGGNAATVNYAVVEFVGLNWQVQRVEHSYTATGVTETENITAISSLTKAFLHTQKRYSAGANTAEFGHEVWLSSIGAISFKLPTNATIGNTHISVAWVIENTQTSGGKMVVQQNNGNTINGAAPLTLALPMATAVNATNNASIFINTAHELATANYPQMIVGAAITGVDTYEIWRSNTGGTLLYRTEIVQWPAADLALRQNYYRMYVDNDALKPTDPWSLGTTTDLGENTLIAAFDDPPADGDLVRIRMDLQVDNATLPAGLYTMKLQYAQRLTSCSAVTNWQDVGAVGSGIIWRGFNATTTVDGTSLSTNPPVAGDLLLSNSNVAGRYTEQNPTLANEFPVFASENIEYDWLIQHNGALQRTYYCFRMVKGDNKVLDNYYHYPELRTEGYTPATEQWRWYNDELNETPVTPMAAESVTPTDVDKGSIVKLRISIHELKNLPQINARFKIQFSEYADFSVVSDVASISSCTATSVWCYANGGGVDNALISTAVLSTSDACVAGAGNGCGVHNETSTDLDGFTHFGGRSIENEYTLKYTNVLRNFGRVYYFRLFDLKINEPVGVNSGYTSPTLAGESARLTFGSVGLTAGTTTEGIITDIPSTPAGILFGSLPFDTNLNAAQRLSVSTNATEGYQMLMVTDQLMLNSYGTSVPGVAGTNATPVAWNAGCTVSMSGCFGYHAGDDLLGGASARFAPNDSYAAFTIAPQEVMYSSVPTNESHDIVYKLRVGQLQPSGTYKQTVSFITVPIY